MISIARFTRDNLKLSERQSAWAQLGVASGQGTGTFKVVCIFSFY